MSQDVQSLTDYQYFSAGILLLNQLAQRDLSMLIDTQEWEPKVTLNKLQPRWCIDGHLDGIPFKAYLDSSVFAPALDEESLSKIDHSTLPQSLQLAIAYAGLTPISTKVREALGLELSFSGLSPAGDNDQKRSLSWEKHSPEGKKSPDLFALDYQLENIEDWLDIIAKLPVTTSRNWTQLTIPFRAERGFAQLTDQEFSNIEVGDVLLMEHQYQENGEFQLVLADSNIRLGAHVIPDGYEIISRINPTQQTLPPVDEQTDEGKKSPRNLYLFDHGDEQINLKDIIGLQAGCVISSSAPQAASPIAMRLQGKSVAKGKFVRVSDHPGIEITEIFPQEETKT